MFNADDPWWYGSLFYAVLLACMIGTPIVLRSVFDVAPLWAWTYGVGLGIFVDAVVLVALGTPVIVARAVYRWLNQ